MSVLRIPCGNFLLGNGLPLLGARGGGGVGPLTLKKFTYPVQFLNFRTPLDISSLVRLSHHLGELQLNQCRFFTCSGKEK